MGSDFLRSGLSKLVIVKAGLKSSPNAALGSMPSSRAQHMVVRLGYASTGQKQDNAVGIVRVNGLELGRGVL